MNNCEIQNINKFNNIGLTKLHIAIKNQDINMIKKLIEQGADINIRAEYNYTPIQYACLSNNYEAVKILLENNANILNEELLHIVCVLGNQRLLKLLIEYGCNVNELDKYGRTPAYWAVQEDNLTCLKILYEQGANFSIKGENEETLLYFATGEKNIVIVQYLLNIGMKNDINDINFPPLILATNYNDKDMVKLLLDNGANINLKDNFGNTALTNSIYYANYEITKLLLEYDIRNNKISSLERKNAVLLLKLQSEKITHIEKMLKI